MRICLLGIGGTFMAGVALIARQLGHEVVGMDQHMYPPMDGVLAEAGIAVTQGYEARDLPAADAYLVGNAMSRGNPAVEHLLNHKLPYRSAPQWLADNVLCKRKVIAVAGTHGKTTTTALLAKMLAESGRDLGYLIAGAAKDFSLPAHLGSSDEFVIEADEYDSAFFDKRSKFIHYRPDLLLINNLEYDHADIFPDLAAIETQFCHLLRSMPSSAQVLYPAGNSAILRCLTKEPHSEYHKILGVSAAHNEAEPTEDAAPAATTTWQAIKQGSVITLEQQGEERQSIQLQWDYPGRHNAMNLLFAAAAATLAGVSPATIAAAAKSFRGVARRLETIGAVNGAPLISDFAHHPTAIEAGIQAVREQFPAKRVVAVVELAANSMMLGVHEDKLLLAVDAADEVLWFCQRELRWDEELKAGHGKIYTDADELAAKLKQLANPDVVLLLMSNSSFGGLPHKLQ